MQTDKLPISDDVRNSPALKRRIEIREMNAEDFVERFASGTLRKNKRVGMAWKKQYLEERVAFEFGWEFKCTPRTYVQFGDANTEGDTKSLTETGWHIDRLMSLSVFPEDRFETKHLYIEYPDGTKLHGVGVVLRSTSAPFIPDGHLVWAIIAEVDALRNDYKKAQNPC